MERAPRLPTSVDSLQGSDAAPAFAADVPSRYRTDRTSQGRCRGRSRQGAARTFRRTRAGEVLHNPDTPPGARARVFSPAPGHVGKGFMRGRNLNLSV
jgi:hypothetical protein